MQISAPKFLDETGYLPFLNLDYVFRQLYEGLAQNRQTLGEERYQTLMQMSGQMRALFEADPEVKTGETLRVCRIIDQMEDILLRSGEKADPVSAGGAADAALPGLFDRKK